MTRLTEEALVDLETKLANVDNDYTPVCKDSRYSYGCGGPTDDTHAFWQAAVEAIPLLLAELREARASLKYWRDGAAIIEKCLLAAEVADPLDVPFPLTGADAKRWHEAQRSAYQYALDMMGPPTDDTEKP